MTLKLIDTTTKHRVEIYRIIVVYCAYSLLGFFVTKKKIFLLPHSTDDVGSQLKEVDLSLEHLHGNIIGTNQHAIWLVVVQDSFEASTVTVEEVIVDMFPVVEGSEVKMRWDKDEMRWFYSAS